MSDCQKADAAVNFFGDIELFGNEHGVGYLPNGILTVSFQSNMEGQVIGASFLASCCGYGTTINLEDALKKFSKQFRNRRNPPDRLIAPATALAAS
jgi:hypothetical protein